MPRKRMSLGSRSKPGSRSCRTARGWDSSVSSGGVRNRLSTVAPVGRAGQCPRAGKCRYIIRRWLERAAGLRRSVEVVPQGHRSEAKPNARFSLGIMYKNGEGVPQDYVQAHMWLNLAASHERMSDAVKERETSPPKWPGAERRGAEAGALNGSQSGSDSFPVQRRPRQRWRSRLQPAQQIPQLDDIRRNAAGRIKAFIHHLYHMLHPLAQHVAI